MLVLLGQFLEYETMHLVHVLSLIGHYKNKSSIHLYHSELRKYIIDI